MMMYLINPWVLILWIAASWLIGMLGKDKRFGFFGNFLVSFLFSPLVGAIVLLASDDRLPPRLSRGR
jgi:4-hydroxybenzoate polyprenyltransferase